MAANSGKANRQVVVKLISDIRNFADVVKQLSDAMMNETEQLGNSWNDPQYRRFESYMRELTEGLKKETHTLYDCANKIEEREIKGLH